MVPLPHIPQGFLCQLEGVKGKDSEIGQTLPTGDNEGLYGRFWRAEYPFHLEAFRYTEPTLLLHIFQVLYNTSFQRLMGKYASVHYNPPPPRTEFHSLAHLQGTKEKINTDGNLVSGKSIQWKKQKEKGKNRTRLPRPTSQTQWVHSVKCAQRERFPPSYPCPSYNAGMKCLRRANEIYFYSFFVMGLKAFKGDK